MLNEDNAEPTLDFRKFDNSIGVDSLLSRIHEILHEGRSHNLELFDRKHWEWQYENLPTGRSNIYICLCDGEIVGYYHVPIYQGFVDNEPKLFAMVQDVAVSESMRGRGVFRKLADFATDDLVNHAGINLIYTFPNSKSIHTFVKYNGYKQVHSYDTFVLPISSAAVVRSKFKFLGLEKILGFFADKYFDLRASLPPAGFEVISKDDFDLETVSLFADFGARFKCHLDRSEEYLNWRYFEKPAAKHFLFTLTENEKLVAAAVFKLDEILGTRAAVLLDLAYTDERNLAYLIQYVRKNSRSLFNENVEMIYTGFCCDDLFAKRRFGFVKVLHKLNPRPLDLLVKNVTERSEIVYEQSSWLALLGDWDVL